MSDDFWIVEEEIGIRMEHDFDLSCPFTKKMKEYLIKHAKRRGNYEMSFKNIQGFIFLTKLKFVKIIKIKRDYRKINLFNELFR